MDFNAIYEMIAPYIGTGAMATGILAIITFCFKAINTFKEMRKTFVDTNAEAINRFKAAIPPELTVTLETITKSEFEKIKTTIAEEIKTEFIEPINANTELCKAIAEALAVSKLTPDAYKEKIKDLLDLSEKEVEATNSLKIELKSEETSETEKEPVKKEKNDKILVD